MTARTLKIVSVIGARPQFIKAAAVSRPLRARAGLKEVLVHTGQHYDEDMSQVFFDELDIPAPDHHLGIGSGAHGEQTGRMLEAIERVLKQEKPDGVLIYGDTNSTLAGALAAAKLKIRLAHVEAGMRSYNREMPEELNRVLADHASDLLFASTTQAVKNLRREGIPAGRIHLVGDVMYDAAIYYGEKGEQKSRVLERLGLHRGSYILATVHRAENTDNAARLWAIFYGLAEVDRRTPVVTPLHPRTRAALAREGILEEISQRIQVINPVGYLDMIVLEKNARVIATDSGGVQKEAFFYRVPCVTLRSETEWVELVKLGWNRLAPPETPKRIDSGIAQALDKKGRAGKPYGGGDAARKIVNLLAKSLSE